MNYAIFDCLLEIDEIQFFTSSGIIIRQWDIDFSQRVHSHDRFLSESKDTHMSGNSDPLALIAVQSIHTQQLDARVFI